jgi:DNA-binding XRE family transcriptional regulator
MQHISEEHPSHDDGMTGAQVRALRKRLRMSQRILARLLHLHPMTIWKLENFRKPVSARVAVKLALLAHQLAPLARNVCTSCGGTGVVDGNFRHIGGIHPVRDK